MQILGRFFTRKICRAYLRRSFHEGISDVKVAVDFCLLNHLVLECRQRRLDGVKDVAEGAHNQSVESLRGAFGEGECRRAAVGKESAKRLGTRQNWLFAQLLKVAFQNRLSLRRCLLACFAKCQCQPL